MTDQRALVTDGRVARRRCHSSIAPSAIKTTRNGTKIGINAAVTDRVAEAMSSTKERGGPRKATLATGRTAALVTCTVPAVAPRIERRHLVDGKLDDGEHEQSPESDIGAESVERRREVDQAESCKQAHDQERQGRVEAARSGESESRRQRHEARIHFTFVSTTLSRALLGGDDLRRLTLLITHVTGP